MTARSNGLALVLGVAAVFAGGCGGGHGHPHGAGDHGHPHGAEGGAVEEHGHPHPSGAEGEEGHGHPHGPDEGHGHPHPAAAPEPPDQAVTQLGGATELFVEFPALVQGRAWPFAVHLTRLDGYRPLEEGTVTVTLRGGGAPEERFVQEGPQRPGYFRTVVEPAHTGLRDLSIAVRAGALEDVHDLGPYVVYGSVEEALANEPILEEEGGADEVTFLKEQQWRLDFDVGEVERRTLRPSLTANGTLRARQHGEAWVSAPQEGRLLEAGPEFPYIGLEVEAGQVLALLAIPFHESAIDPATLDLAVERSRVELDAAERELERLAGLFSRGAIPERRVIEARTRRETAAAELGAARRRLQSFREQQRSEGEGAAGRIALKAPIGGTVVASQVVPGVFVDPGDPLFHIVDPSRLWLEVHVPAAHAFRVEGAVGAWFEVEGSARTFEVTPATGGRLVTVGGLVDPSTRTVPVVFELPNPDRSLRVGMYARVRVLTGEPRAVPAVPRAALVEEEGKTVAYVQLGGETFERRVVRAGLRDGEWVEVLEGLDAGEVVVVEGAYYVRLAAAGGAVPSHGHAH